MIKPLLVSSVVTSSLFALEYCPQQAEPAPCNQESCQPCYCYGPENVITNPPLSPITCNGDVEIKVSVLSWQADEDGLEYAIDTNTVFINDDGINGNFLIDAEYHTPKFKKNYGFKLGIAYASPCDGWDLRALWTNFQGRAASKNQIHNDPERTDYNVFDTKTLLPLWTAFQGIIEDIYGPSFATDCSTNWKSYLNLIDLELGRNAWVSRYLAFRPHVGIRLAKIDQKYEIYYSGGSWAEVVGFQPAYNDSVELDNDFKGVGLRLGFDLDWNFGCGWSLYSEFAASILYGLFTIDHDETVREAQAPFPKTKVLETENRFHASRSILDLSLGLQYATLICGCQYGITARFGWEQHLFFHQNQMWRVNRIGTVEYQDAQPFPSNGGENNFFQRRGTLSTKGWTFTFIFEF